MPKATTRGRTIRVSKKNTDIKNPRDSHLYTDDNPATTIHGTGFKDKTAANRTLDLIKDRSLTYQSQTVNTMYHRAKHHPSMKNKIKGSAAISGMEEAMAIFRHWLDVTYPAERESLRAGGFRPLLDKLHVNNFMAQIQKSDQVGEEAKVFAHVYRNLAKGKKLGNVLVDNSKPKEADWERLRYDTLDQLVPEGKEKPDAWKTNELWEEDHVTPTYKHLEMIAWAWSPCKDPSKMSNK